MGYIKFNVIGKSGTGIIAQEQIINIDKVIIVRAGLAGASDDSLQFITGILPDQDPTTPDTPQGYVEQIVLRGAGFTAATVKKANDAILAAQNVRVGALGPVAVDFKPGPGETFTHVEYLVSKQ